MVASSALRIFYRTSDARADYEFAFVRTADAWRVYILWSPDYAGRDDGAVATHRLSDEAGRRYVCWTGRLQSTEDAMRVAAAWADATQRYIATGKQF